MAGFNTCLLFGPVYLLKKYLNIKITYVVISGDNILCGLDFLFDIFTNFYNIIELSCCICDYFSIVIRYLNTLCIPFCWFVLNIWRYNKNVRGIIGCCYINIFSAGFGNTLILKRSCLKSCLKICSMICLKSCSRIYLMIYSMRFIIILFSNLYLYLLSFIEF